MARSLLTGTRIHRRHKAAPAAYILRDEFTTTEAAPLATPRTCEPGPGTLTVTDDNSVISIADGALLIDGTPAANNGLVTALQARTAGRTFSLNIASLTSVNSSQRLGWSTNPLSGAAISIGFDLGGAGGIARIKDGVNVIDGGAFDPDGHVCAFIMRASGGFLVTNGKLRWVYPNDTSDLYAKLYLAATAADLSIDSWRLCDLPAPWATDYGIATQRLEGARSAGDTFTHEADCLIEFEADALPTNNEETIDFRFRIQDASNYWQLTIDDDGDLALNEIVAGAPTTRGSDAGHVAAGDRIVILCDDETIKVYEANTLRITYTSAANFKTETDGELEAVAAGAAVKDIVAWPRVLSGTALSQLEKYTS